MKDYNLNWSTSFELDENSPSGLSKIKSRVGKDTEKHNVGYKRFNENGTSNSWRIGFQGKYYLVHRIIWVMVYGSIDPEMVIDHIDGNPHNNQISNLSLKTQANNARNQKRFSTNTTGITGVSLATRKGGYRYFIVQWTELNGKRKQKCFSVVKLGEELAEFSAQLYREQQIQRLITEGADYTSRHGQSPYLIL